MKVKSLTDTVAKWATRAAAAGPDYEKGVKDTSVDWAGPTAAAASSYADGVSAAVADGRFARKVSEAGTTKWRNKASTSGVARFAGGVRDGQPDYQKGMTGVLATLSGITLPPRYKRGDPRNNDRVNTITTALHEAKIKG